MTRRPFLRFLSALAWVGVVACGDDAPTEPTNPDTNSPTVTLTVALSAGVVGSPSSTGPYARGTSVSYAYNAQPGYQNLQVTIDGAPVPATGTVTMDRSRTLAATATRVAAAARAGGGTR